jgi:hypothetical protein
MTVATGELGAFLHDRKNRKVISHRIIAAGYEIIRNDAAKDGLWVINGARKTIYAKKSLTVPEQIKAAQHLAAAAPKTDWQRKSEQMAAEQELARQAKAATMNQTMQ